MVLVVGGLRLSWLGVDSWVLLRCLCACWVIGFLRDWSLWVCERCLWVWLLVCWLAWLRGRDMGCLILLLLELLWVALGLAFGWICWVSCWVVRWFSCAGLLFGGWYAFVV